MRHCILTDQSRGQTCYRISTHHFIAFRSIARPMLSDQPPTMLPRVRLVSQLVLHLFIMYPSQQPLQPPEVDRLEHPPVDTLLRVFVFARFFEGGGDGDDGCTRLRIGWWGSGS
jgi:hypothetical protein